MYKPLDALHPLALPIGEMIQPLPRSANVSAMSCDRTVKVTGTDCGELEMPLAVTITWPLYVPVAKLAVFTATVTLPLVEPEVGDADSQAASVDVVYEKLPDPGFMTASVCDGGAACPILAVKLMLPGVTEIEGGGLTTVRFALITWDELTAPNATNVMVAP